MPTSDENATQEDSLTRVLVFDKNKNWCAQLINLFRDVGGSIRADSESETFANCSAKMEEEDNLYHYLIVNYHSLQHPQNDLLNFSSEFPTVEIVLIGEYEDPEMVKYLWPPHPIAHYNYGSKRDRPLTELTELIAQLDQVRRRIGNLRVNFGSEVEEALNEFSKFRSASRTEDDRSRKSTSLSIMKQELRVVLGALFSSKTRRSEPIATEVDVKPFVESGKSSSCLLTITPTILLGGSQKSAVLKFGPKDDIGHESENYDRFVEWFLTIDQTVRKIGYAEANKFSGLLYSYPRDVTSGYQPFARFIRNRPTEDSEAVIHAMFNTSNKQWLSVNGNKHTEPSFGIFQDYYIKQVLHASIPEMRSNHLPKLMKEVHEIEKRLRIDIMEVDDNTISFSAFALKVPNAITRLGAQQITKTLKLTVIHGDLHAHNILVDEKDPRRYFFIDFFYTGFGDIYRDFIELEISIRYDLFSSRELSPEEQFTHPNSQNSKIEGMKKLVALEKALLDFSFHGKDLQNPTIMNDERLLKAFRLITKVREYAKANCPEKWPLYFAGLALSCLKGIKYFYPTDVKMHRLIISGMCLQYLDKSKLLDDLS